MSQLCGVPSKSPGSGSRCVVTWMCQRSLVMGGGGTEASPRQEDPARREGHMSQRSEDGGAFVHHQRTENWLGIFASKPKETKTAKHVRTTQELPFGL